MSGLFYVIGMTQLLVVLCTILFCSDVTVQIFFYYPRTINGTLSHDPGDSKTLTMSLSIPMVMCSFLATIFVSNTFQLIENNQISEEQSYSMDVLKECGMWDFVFWMYVFFVHLICGLTMDTPVDGYSIMLGLYMQVHFLILICQPNEDELRNFTKSNINSVGLLAGFIILLWNIPVDGNNRYSICFVLFVYDYFLCVGHTWDLSPRMGTICNARLCYVCIVPLCLAGLYGIWNDRLLFNPLSPVNAMKI